MISMTSWSYYSVI